MPGSSCPSATRLTEAEVTWLDNLSHAAHEVTGPVQCELEAGHPGRHVGLAPADDIGGADARRSTTGRGGPDSSAHEISNEETCGAKDPKGELCLLPVGHPGRHLF